MNGSKNKNRNKRKNEIFDRCRIFAVKPTDFFIDIDAELASKIPKILSR